MMVFKVFCTFALLLCLSNADTGNPALPKSICPESFRYDSVDTNNKILKGTLMIVAPHTLNGLWIRLLFNNPVDELKVEDGFGEVERRDGNIGFLIKNPSNVFRKGSRKVLKISIKFTGSEIPELMEYRLNAVTVCPNVETTRTAFFPNDIQATNSNYLQSTISLNNAKIPSNYQCGQLPKEQPENTYPWHASLYINQNDSTNYVCSAILVSPQYLVTAAHCVTFLKSTVSVPVDSIVVSMAKQNPNEVPVSTKQVQDIQVYPGYQSDNLLNDIAVVKLVDPINDNQIQPVCLPDNLSSKNEEETLEGYQIENGKFSKLTSTKVLRVSDDKCFSRSESLRSLLGDNTYCASYLEDNKVCVGDSGSASISIRNGRWELNGVLSVGVALQVGQQEQCDNSSNLLFTEVSRYSRWLNSVVFQ